MPTILQPPSQARVLEVQPHHPLDRPPWLRTLTENMLGLFVIGLLVTFGTFGMSRAALAKAAEDQRVATVMTTLLAHDMYVLAQALPRQEDGGSRWPGTLAQLADASFDPPLQADGDSYAGLQGWSQEVQVAALGPDVERMGRPATVEEIAAGDVPLQLVVGVRHHGVKVGSYRWWLLP